MSQPRSPQPAKLVIGLLLGDKSLFLPAAERLVAAFGAVDMVSPWLEFDFTDYYRAEMGTSLHRRLLVFERLVEQRQLSQIKIDTNAVEQNFAIEKRRRVNIDPGYLLLERFVLATGKNYSHRIYIGDRIYADLTLVFQKGDYQPLPWTYPDYAHDRMRAFLRQVRRKYSDDLKRVRPDEAGPPSDNKEPPGTLIRNERDNA